MNWLLLLNENSFWWIPGGESDKHARFWNYDPAKWPFWTPIYEADTFEMIFWKVWHCRFARVTHWKVQDFWKNNKKVFFFLKKYSFLDFCEGYDDFLQWNLVISEDLGTAESSKSSIFEQKKEVLNGNEIDHICSHRFFFSIWPYPAKSAIIRFLDIIRHNPPKSTIIRHNVPSSSHDPP